MGRCSARSRSERTGRLVATLVFVALVVAAIGSLGAPLITSVARTYRLAGLLTQVAGVRAA
jgi:hypothetical protein